LKDAQALKKKIDGMANSEKLEKLGIAPREKRIDSFFQEFLDNARLRTSPNTTKRYRAVLNTFITFLKMFHPRMTDLAQITPEIIESYQKQRLQSIELKKAADADNPFNRKEKLLPKPQTVNYEVSVLRSVLTWAHEKELIHSVPTKRVKPLRVSSRKQARLLSSEECKHFLKTAREISKTDNGFKVFALAFKFLLNTGLRSGELSNLTWNDVDLKTGLLKIRPKEGWTPKSYSREFFLNQAAIDVLERLKTDSSHVFVDGSGHQLDNDSLRNALIKVAKLADFEDLTRVHDLRHTFNSLMQMNGVDPATMGKILGHKDIETTMIYTHQTDEHLKRSIGKIDIR
jgi:integrase/recombinase XerD